jgi:hypothetical protein
MSHELIKVKAALQRELDALQRMADTLNLKVALGRADMRSELGRLETKLRRAREDILRINQHLKAPLYELESGVLALLAEVRAGLARMRQGFERSN